MIKIISRGIESGRMESLLTNNIKGDGDIDDLIIKDNNILYQITFSNNQNNKEYKNISTILFKDCENRLKNIYNIDKNLSLIIFKVDYYKDNSLIPLISYNFFHPKNYSKLDLKHCENKMIYTNIPVVINENKLYKYDPNSDYYLNDCYPYTTDHGTDIILKDRQDEYNNNLAICENNCEFKNYSSYAKKSICICDIKSKEIDNFLSNNKDNFLSINFPTDEGSFSSLGTMKCYYTLFSKNGLIKNIAFYLFLFFLFLQLYQQSCFIKMALVI